MTDPITENFLTARTVAVYPQQCKKEFRKERRWWIIVWFGCCSTAYICSQQCSRNNKIVTEYRPVAGAEKFPRPVDTLSQPLSLTSQSCTYTKYIYNIYQFTTRRQNASVMPARQKTFVPLCVSLSQSRPILLRFISLFCVRRMAKSFRSKRFLYLVMWLLLHATPSHFYGYNSSGLYRIMYTHLW